MHAQSATEVAPKWPFYTAFYSNKVAKMPSQKTFLAIFPQFYRHFWPNWPLKSNPKFLAFLGLGAPKPWKIQGNQTKTDYRTWKTQRKSPKNPGNTMRLLTCAKKPWKIQ